MRSISGPTIRLSHRLVGIIGMASLLAILSLFSLAPAEASTDRVLQAFGNGGRAILFQHGVVLSDFAEGLGAPADSEVRAAIRPLPLWDGRHFCAKDWHVILISIFDGGDQSFDVQDARASLDPVGIEFVLDGAALPTERTSISRFSFAKEMFGMEKAFYFQEGAVLPPAALTVGSHMLHMTLTDSFGSATSQITFFIDAPGAGVCL